ncbi:MAG TPA: 4-(cytidine 5'-diphospho)-2-C-methyl-D-erythritol kinase [Xanthobacteraceae bacterium]|nr:4-(cytidine 5'-diphospho)-2-C-methyl-D-erythritol kinase [Xanthobacteraceae bacterium]
MPTARVERAPAKVNLTLRVLGRRPDGYHEIESLVVFAGVGDTLTFTPGKNLMLKVLGPTAALAGDLADNLVLKAVRALGERYEGLRLGQFVLSKHLPVAAGVGGGSADAAAALRHLARQNHIRMDDARLLDAARSTGADIPVCLDPQPRMMRGIGEILSAPWRIPPLPALLINPRVAVPTKEVFKALGAPSLAPGHASVPIQDEWANGTDQSRSCEPSCDDVIAYVTDRNNDLEAPAIALNPTIGQALDALRLLPGCRLARMSGSGATCFALFPTRRAAQAAARILRAARPTWWIRPTVLGGG